MFCLLRDDDGKGHRRRWRLGEALASSCVHWYINCLYWADAAARCDVISSRLLSTEPRTTRRLPLCTPGGRTVQLCNSHLHTASECVCAHHPPPTASSCKASMADTMASWTRTASTSSFWLMIYFFSVFLAGHQTGLLINYAWYTLKWLISYRLSIIINSPKWKEQSTVTTVRRGMDRTSTARTHFIPEWVATTKRLVWCPKRDTLANSLPISASKLKAQPVSWLIYFYCFCDDRVLSAAQSIYPFWHHPFLNVIHRCHRREASHPYLHSGKCKIHFIRLKKDWKLWLSYTKFTIQKMENQCGEFRYEHETLSGCILTCHTDGCNSAGSNLPLAVLSFLAAATAITRQQLITA